jgi:hypothetical protein
MVLAHNRKKKCRAIAHNIFNHNILLHVNLLLLLSLLYNVLFF